MQQSKTKIPAKKINVLWLFGYDHLNGRFII